MRIEPAEKQQDLFDHLSPLQQRTRKAAIIIAGIGTFVWVFKILFF